RNDIVDRIDITQGEPDEMNVRREWINRVINFILSLLEYGITPIFVFDGTALPDKAATREDRNLAQKAIRDEIDHIYSMLKVNPVVPQSVLKRLQSKIKQLKVMSEVDHQCFRIIVKAMGVPCR